MTRISVKVAPKASSDAVLGWIGDSLKVCVVAAPEKGRANAAVERVLAEALGVAAARVRVIGGRTSRRKLVEVAGMDAEEARRRLPR